MSRLSMIGRLGYEKPFVASLAMVFVGTALVVSSLHAQNIPAVQADLFGLQAQGMGIAAQAANSKPQLLRQMRGLIQNELSIVGDVCGLNEKQSQTLVDLAESEWKEKTNASIIKRTQENVVGTTDLDSLAERVVRTWLEATADTTQLSKYDEELADRMKWRQRALVSKLLDTLEAKLNLSANQMEKIEVVLNEKWRDKWFRSLEATFENSSFLPEIRPVWISEFLSDSQKSALVTRAQQRFGAVQVSQDAPSLGLDEPFAVGTQHSFQPKNSDTNLKTSQKAAGARSVEEILKRALKEEAEESIIDAKKP